MINPQYRSIERSITAKYVDIHDLTAFRAVAELGNFRKAAESIHISQLAFSRRIEKQEEALGTKLLERTTRRVNLTAIGRDFDKQVRQILDALDHPLAKMTSVRWADLVDYDYISVSKGSGNRLLLDQALAGMSPLPHSLYETQHGTTMIGLVEAGLGVAAVPAMAMPKKGHPLLVSVPLTDPVVTRKMGLIRRRSSMLTPAAQQLYEMIFSTKQSRKLR